MKKILISLLIALFIVYPPIAAQAAGFDCTKATTKVEKMICKDAELSRLDEELTLAYPKALEKAPDPILVKFHQQSWLKERNTCKDIACLRDQYELRIGELNRIISLVPLASGEESHYFEKQADKFKVIQDIVRRQTFVHYNQYEKEPLHCKEFMKDFLSGRHFVMIEPDFITNDEDDPRFDKFNRCREYNFPEGSRETDFSAVMGLGGPPYSYYHIDTDGNLKNGKEDIICNETDAAGSKGCTWVDAAGCMVKGGVGFGGGWQGRPRHFYRLFTLVLYKGKPISLGIELDFVSQKPPTKYDFDVQTFIKDDVIQHGCSWEPGLNDQKTISHQK